MKDSGPIYEAVRDVLSDDLFDVSWQGLDSDQRRTVEEMARSIERAVWPLAIEHGAEAVDLWRKANEGAAAVTEIPAETPVDQSVEEKPAGPDLATVWAHGADAALVRVKQGLATFDQRVAAAVPSYRKEGAQSVLRDLRSAIDQLVVDGARRRVDRPRRRQG